MAEYRRHFLYEDDEGNKATLELPSLVFAPPEEIEVGMATPHGIDMTHTLELVGPVDPRTGELIEDWQDRG